MPLSDDELAAIHKALEPVRDAEFARGMEAGRMMGIKDAYHVVLEAAVDPVGDTIPKEQWSDHYDKFKAALKVLRAAWPELAPESNEN